MTVENPRAGQGAVIVDIGGDIGALVVLMPNDMIGVEVEIVPTGTADSRAHRHSHAHPHDHDEQPPHVAVVARPLPNGTVVASLVFGSMPAGTYDLYIRPDGPVSLTVHILGGEITEALWPVAAA